MALRDIFLDSVVKKYIPIPSSEKINEGYILPLHQIPQILKEFGEINRQTNKRIGKFLNKSSNEYQNHKWHYNPSDALEELGEQPNFKLDRTITSTLPNLNAVLYGSNKERFPSTIPKRIPLETLAEIWLSFDDVWTQSGLNLKTTQDGAKVFVENAHQISFWPEVSFKQGKPSLSTLHTSTENLFEPRYTKLQFLINEENNTATAIARGRVPFNYEEYESLFKRYAIHQELLIQKRIETNLPTGDLAYAYSAGAYRLDVFPTSGKNIFFFSDLLIRGDRLHSLIKVNRKPRPIHATDNEDNLLWGLNEVMGQNGRVPKRAINYLFCEDNLLAMADFSDYSTAQETPDVGKQIETLAAAQAYLRIDTNSAHLKYSNFKPFSIQESTIRSRGFSDIDMNKLASLSSSYDRGCRFTTGPDILLYDMIGNSIGNLIFDFESIALTTNVHWAASFFFEHGIKDENEMEKIITDYTRHYVRCLKNLGLDVLIPLHKQRLDPASIIPHIKDTKVAILVKELADGDKMEKEGHLRNKAIYSLGIGVD